MDDRDSTAPGLYMDVLSIAHLFVPFLRLKDLFAASTVCFIFIDTI
jgi:hypothetical protein